MYKYHQIRIVLNLKLTILRSNKKYIREMNILDGDQTLYWIVTTIRYYIHKVELKLIPFAVKGVSNEDLTKCYKKAVYYLKEINSPLCKKYFQNKLKNEASKSSIRTYKRILELLNQ